MLNRHIMKARPRSFGIGSAVALANREHGVLQRSLADRYYATTGSFGDGSRALRKQVTVTSDDGQVRWQDLTTREKAARTTQQTFNFGVVITGLLGTGLVAYFLYREVFSTDSKTTQFNRAVDRIRADSTCLELLGDKKTISAYGEPTNNKWARARPIASSLQVDPQGVEHFRMHFNVEGSERKGVVSLHMVKEPSHTDFEYRLLALDVPGFPRHFLESASSRRPSKSPGFRWFGVQWK